MFVSTHFCHCAVLIAFVLSFLHADLTKLPTSELVMDDISNLLSRSGFCELCGEVLRNLDVFQLSQSTALTKATQGYEKPQSAFLRACERDPNTPGCDTALHRSWVERTKRGALTISQVEQLYSEEDGEISKFIQRRYDDLLEYLLEEREQEECTSCIVEDGCSPRLVTDPLAEMVVGHLWYQFYPLNERHKAFCWQYCEGLLTFWERLWLWMLRFYLTRAVRFRLIALQRERGTIFFLLVQLLLILTVLQRYVSDSRRSGGGGSGGGGGGGSAVVTANGHPDVNLVTVARTGPRRSMLGRGKGGGGKRE